MKDAARIRWRRRRRSFDMGKKYGPCISVTRLRGWERAAAMGLRPPPHIQDLVLRRGD
jgi:DNA polymerase delta subunit 4